ncbi:helix-turn-helix domain-containing protein [Chryseobacterium lactis]|uniref:helix-turn-helix domain-containing protein n=1 Tax=Chryseobacterium lactis TaxID=1241981 RepID=UPI0016283AD9|nr:helix-turn-helix domain-containing protein [Chryseobacterium lactis]
MYDTTKITQRFDFLESKLDLLFKEQEEFSKKMLLKLSLNTKRLFTKPEAAEFLGLNEKYLDQLTHQKKLKFLKRKGQKFKYFRKEDLEEYILGTGTEADDDFEGFENDILQKF